jgi:hypothetical protein
MHASRWTRHHNIYIYLISAPAVHIIRTGQLEKPFNWFAERFFAEAERFFAEAEASGQFPHLS